MHKNHDNYSNLKNHLNNKLNLINETIVNTNNELVNEGLMDAISKMFGSKKPADDKTKQATGLFGFISLAANQIKGIFGSGSSDSKTDRISAKYKDLAKKEMEDEKRRLENEIKAEEDLEIEKLESEYKVNKQRLDAKSIARVESYRAKQKQVKNIGDRIAKSQLLYSEEDTQVLLNTIKTAGKDLEVDGDSPIAEMRDLTLQILIKPDGTTRTLEEVKKEVNDNPEGELAKLVKRQSEMATKYKQQSLVALDSDGFADMVKKHCGDISELDNARSAVDAAKEEQELHKKKTAAYTALTKMQKAHGDAAKEVNEATDALATLIGGKKADGTTINNNDRNPFCMSYDKDSKKVGPLGTDEYRTALKTAINQVKQGDLSDEEKNQAIKDKLKELGIDDENLVSNLFADGGDMDAKIDELDDDKIAAMAKKTAEKMTSKVAEAQAAVTTAKTKLSENPDPSTEEGRKAINETGTDEQKALLETYNAAGNPELSTESEFYEGSSANTSMSEEIQSKITKNQKIVDDATSQTKANITQLQNAQAADESRKTKQIPDELKADIEKAASGIQAGEVVCGEEGENKGKIGFYKPDPNDPKKKIFVPKPKHGSTDKSENEYIAARNMAIMQTQPKDIGDSTWDDIGKIEANSDGTYTIYNKNGEVFDDKASREEAINIRAAQVSKERSRAQAIKLKQDIAEKLKGINKNGELDHKALKALSAEEQALIRDMIKSGTDFSEFFKGIDLNDSDLTTEEIANMFPKDLQKEFLHEIDADEDKGEGDDWEDDDEDHGDDEDLKNGGIEKSDEMDDDEDKPKNDAGEDLVKGDDGKWYKKKEDGTADTEAGEQTNVAKKNKTLKNPAKEWRRRKNKVTGKKTKNYFNVHDKKESISRKEFLKRVEIYKKAIAKRKAKEVEEVRVAQQGGESDQQSFNYVNLGNHLFESIGVDNKYSKLRDCILNNLNN